jgi:CheY-like chemotaxis protein
VSKVVIMTGSLLKGDREKAIRLGADAFLNKPATMEDFDRTAEALRTIFLEDNHADAVDV